jgi:N-acetylmuramoyl-L-alanine amidase
MLSFPQRPHSVDVMARTLWGEARSGGEVAMSHVASVIINRAEHPKWWGKDVPSVCQAPAQFSCWNKNDPNRVKLLAVTEDDAAFAIAVRVASAAISKRLPDATSGADSYCALSMARPPAWANRAKETFRDRWHVFYRLELPLPGTNAPAAPCVRGDMGIPISEQHQDVSADDLNAAELARVKGHTS